MAAAQIRELRIKTGSVNRMMKDLVASGREIERQVRRIQEYKDDPERDEHDVKKQEEVLDEYKSGRSEEFSRLGGFTTDLSECLDLCAEVIGFNISESEEVENANVAVGKARAILETKP
uniref:Tubulin-specific chaperone A n=1 Tax=Coccolithus braarudii TaxID=221442 RepID=A0A7S0PWD3_9EUKA|mmetsp:Transcript_15986/g.34707  ORF Transcript_15986/g.34707 Transcript_15986/m.34707 type:complete len:119 (+) Transcript_15986:67-423(+)|eukprot:CAMPEP_0183354150 /NCGR_PEP_ID=MMETSP0164_2-20130417/36965_1 /TAXON_ID=221442 /ORGANISM="Coccolithus pelagicus ssp braarudi, Strain PLY182g" /LENGTH=118 /DNA_ID=CAMNT_0025526985 /DNA_START=66 /DNA_END=422 /DNA_ORIENTATION=+